jgi:hypothetical protein
LAVNDNRILPKRRGSGLGSFGQRPTPGKIVPRFIASPAHQADPYLLVLLADQEIAANRPEQARCLIEAAYAVYDQGRPGS